MADLPELYKDLEELEKKVLAYHKDMEHISFVIYNDNVLANGAYSQYHFSDYTGELLNNISNLQGVMQKYYSIMN